MRRDAAVNRDRLLAAGREVFATRGLEATLNDVAHHAGVGVGTAYRHFANKDELIEAILVQQAEEITAILGEALGDPDPWSGLVSYMERALAVQVKDRGMAQIFSGRHSRPEKHDWIRDRTAPLVNRVADRAREAGALREHVTGTDLIMLQIAVVAIATTAQDGPVLEDRDDTEQLYRRYLAVALDGLRPPGKRVNALPVPPLTTEQLHRMLGSTHR